jgi:starch phosphorylase
MRTLRYAHSFEVVSELPLPLRPLKRLAMNFRWSWRHETRQLFQEVDPQLWEEVGHNPMELLGRLSGHRKRRLIDDAIFLAKLKLCEDELAAYLASDTWFDRKFPGQRERTCVAYFCAEFGISECLPIYSGGLGVLAGDHLKAASDLGVPLVGVGLLYSRGYFRQHLSIDGWQQEHYPQYDFYRFPLQLIRGGDDEPLRVAVEFPDRAVTVQIWRAQVGRIPLYLLDSNVLENLPDDQSITDTLYGGDEHMRIRQEMILGIGGMRALKALGIKPTTCHMNEGHAAFLTIERLRQVMDEHGCDLRTARQIVVNGNCFTTHTPVPAGFDVFQPPLLEQYMLKSIQQVGLGFDDFLKLGRIDPSNIQEPFNMAVLAMENANYVNGVSRLHAHVTRGMFHARWPEYPREEVPVDAVTNGVHTMTWISRRMCELLDRHLGPAWRDDASDPDVWERAAEIPENDLWELRENERGDFVRYVRRSLLRSLTRRNAVREDLARAGGVLDPRILTIGFARRFATYKRAQLLFADKERLKALLFHPERPVQIVFAGKSHPRDDGGKKLIQDIWNFIHHEGARGRMVFLEDYDMEVARHLVQGVDVWLNNPRRPMEASGTSGMKVVPNGGLNLSVLDGWWAEGYKPGTGWAIGTSLELADHGHQDWLDSRSLYQLLEGEVAPLFYSRGEAGIPQGWIEMMRRSLRELAPRFSTLRMVREYCARFYVSSSNAFNRLEADGQVRAKEALNWRDRVRASWKDVAIKKVSDTGQTVNQLGDEFCIRAEVALGSLKPEDVRVQVLVGAVSAARELVDVEVHDLRLVTKQGSTHNFEVELRCDVAGHRGYILRVVPHHQDVRVASELAMVCWQQSVA